MTRLPAHPKTVAVRIMIISDGDHHGGAMQAVGSVAAYPHDHGKNEVRRPFEPVILKNRGDLEDIAARRRRNRSVPL
jgi:hypothetical protein